MFTKYNKVQRAVLEATLELISEKDLQATSMALISQKSGVSTGSIYYYFQSKEDIINELYKGIVKFSGEVVLKDFYSKDCIEERFKRTWGNVIRFSMNYPKAIQFMEQYSFSPYIDDAAKQEACKRGWCGALSQLYEQAIEQQLFIALEPRLMVQMHLGSVIYLIKAYFQKNIDLTDDIIETVIHTFWKAVSKGQLDYKLHF